MKFSHYQTTSSVVPEASYTGSDIIDNSVADGTTASKSRAVAEPA
jgi:hypothetical protein